MKKFLTFYAACALIGLAFWATVIFVVVHFVAKVW